MDRDQMDRDRADAFEYDFDSDSGVDSDFRDDRGKRRAILERVRSVSHLLDEAIRVPGTNVRFGLDPILGIVPGAGDLVAALASLYIVAEGVRADLPRSALLKMLGNVAVDVVVGSIPGIGPLFDALWKANVRNARILEEHLNRESADQVPVV